MPWPREWRGHAGEQQQLLRPRWTTVDYPGLQCSPPPKVAPRKAFSYLVDYWTTAFTNDTGSTLLVGPVRIQKDVGAHREWVPLQKTNNGD
jgi:hypothetical protein